MICKELTLYCKRATLLGVNETSTNEGTVDEKENYTSMHSMFKPQL